MSAEAAKVLRDAAHYVREHGLAKGDFGSAGGRCCTIGSIGAVINGNPGSGWMGRRFPDMLEAAAGTDIISWNDAPERTADDVIGLLERVADGQAALS